MYGEYIKLANGSHLAETCRSALLNSFGCQQAYESFGGPNSRATSDGYADFGFGSDPVLGGTADTGIILDADVPDLDGGVGLRRRMARRL